MRQFSEIHASELTTMHCGGKIALLYEPDSRGQVRELISSLDDFIVLGGGSNMIFADTLITRPVIRLGKGFETITRDGNTISAGAALLTGKLLSYCSKNALSGLEFLAGIPGRIGGALFMNAGTATLGIMDAVLDVEIAYKDGIRMLRREDIPYGYRHGGIAQDAVILGARFALSDALQDVADTIATFMEKRRSQPGGYSSGSVFKNPPGSPAGMLIEQAGLKGVAIGGAKVSEVHANYIINEGNASTSDIKDLISMIKRRVWEKFGIELIEEVRIIG
jgi:UDP-N-acetylmuramate dehydrogenase